MTNKIFCLNDALGYVELVCTSGTDKTVVDAARVSHNNDDRSKDATDLRDRKLIQYLADHKHTSPFEHVVFTFIVKCPLFIARQWMRHRTWSYNEISGRYTEMDVEYYTPLKEHIGTQGTANKQARYLGYGEGWGGAADRIRDAYANATGAYYDLLDNEVPREVARMVLPLGLYTRFYATVDLNNLIKFVGLRDHEGAQWEIQQYARAVAKLAAKECPISVSALLGEHNYE